MLEDCFSIGKAASIIFEAMLGARHLLCSSSGASSDTSGGKRREPLRFSMRISLIDYARTLRGKWSFAFPLENLLYGVDTSTCTDKHIYSPKAWMAVAGVPYSDSLARRMGVDLRMMKRTSAIHVGCELNQAQAKI